MRTVLGIDIGSVAISLVLIDEDKSIRKASYHFHDGAIPDTLKDLLKDFDLNNLCGIAVTTSTPKIINYSFPYDSQLSIINAVKHFHNDVGSILFIGAENFGLIKFNKKGEYKSFKSNSSCASGTGSFLDQQAIRLNLKSSRDLSNEAISSSGDSPPIATRCAVFSKTDLIHAQQEGYSLGQISDGLCEGLAKNVIDTVLHNEHDINTPLIFSGGVSMNDAVVKHLSHMLKVKPVIDEYSRHYGAIGAALLYLEERKLKPISFDHIDSLIKNQKNEKVYGYKPLNLSLSSYPEFSSEKRYLFSPKKSRIKIEIDLYDKLKGNIEVYLGIDIGSTSTKGILLNRQNKILAGFYTRTSGQPIIAVQNIFEAINDITKKHKVSFNFLGVSTTGSGRKFIGKIINADLVIDEISAHARAAYELNNEVDTIIEIGGQDSKFTTLKDGMVTFSVMNNVCAAGTGSFIEEQARKLGCDISEFSERAMTSSAPLSSDRCTVFMERDINHYLVNGYSKDEVLASILHSIRDNYLMKVAVLPNIGETICFQGATAKNKALIAAFEQKINKPIFVSKFCHLTGALGSALLLSEANSTSSNFRGINLYKSPIPFESEVCKLCHNNCKITKVTVQGETVAFGFLCGRDYDTQKYVSNKTNLFNLFNEREKAFTIQSFPKKEKSKLTIGFPSALYLLDEEPIWSHFFNALKINIISSMECNNPVEIGKSISGAEFCSPMYSFFGNIKYLSDKADYLFLPIYLESREKQKGRIRQYCYYTQYASSLAATLTDFDLKNKLIMPQIDSHIFNVTVELFKLLNPITKCSYWSVYSAYQGALDFHNEGKSKLKKIFLREFDSAKDISVLVMGRPYTILNKNLNKGILNIFSEMGIKSFFQDMIEYSKEEMVEIEELLKAFHWNYASKIIESALISAKTNNLYPVFITSFKCAPDSFTIEYFKRIMEKYQKPYLILQLDEHNSTVGYDTRIEAAIRAFRNHSNKSNTKILKENALPIIPKVTHKLNRKTLLFPCWDTISSKLLESILIREGYDARMVSLSQKAIQLGPTTNSGMCLPVNIITESYIEYIEENCLDPEQTAVWMFEALIACNIKMYPYFIKSAFESYGRGLEKVDVYIGKISFLDISYQASIDAYFAHMFGGALRKIGCKIRPYENTPGVTDKIIDQSTQIFHNTFLGNRNKEDDVIKVVNLFKAIDTTVVPKPKVAIFGDIYVRDNDIINQNLNHCIEDYGGEVITTPFSDIVKIMTDPFLKRSMKFSTFKQALTTKAIVTLVNSLEKNYYKHFNEVLKEPQNDINIDYRDIYNKFNLKIGHYGESADNLLAMFSLAKRDKDISLFVQTNPAFCCAGVVTEAMNARIEELTGVPIITLNYDSTNKEQNKKLIPYIKFAQKK